MANVEFDKRFAPAEATRGSWAPIDASTIAGGIPSASRGKYAQLTYLVGSEPGSLNLALSGGTVILPVSAVNISEPLQVENTPGQVFNVTTQDVICSVEVLPDTTVYSPTTIAPLAISAITFSPNVKLIEIFNTDTSIPVYVGFNNVSLQTLSAEALPVVAEAFYSASRDTATVYVGNVDASNPIDVRIIGHYKS
jgi:hypothetical protein